MQSRSIHPAWKLQHYDSPRRTVVCNLTRQVQTKREGGESLLILLSLYAFTILFSNQIQDGMLTCQSWSTWNSKLVIMQCLRKTFILLQQQTPEMKRRKVLTFNVMANSLSGSIFDRYHFRCRNPFKHCNSPMYPNIYNAKRASLPLRMTCQIFFSPLPVMICELTDAYEIRRDVRV